MAPILLPPEEQAVEDALQSTLGPPPSILDITLPLLILPPSEGHWLGDMNIYGEVLKAVAQPTSEVDLGVAAALISELTPSPVNPRQSTRACGRVEVRVDPGKHLRRLWDMFQLVCEQIPFDLDIDSGEKLVDLLKELKNRPEVAYFMVNGNVLQLWKDLLLLSGPSCITGICFPCPPSSVPTEAVRSAASLHQGWMNKSAIYAQIFARSEELQLNLGLHTTLLTLAINTLSATLESGPRQPSNVRDAHLRASAQWIMRAGWQLLKEAHKPVLLRANAAAFQQATPIGPRCVGNDGIDIRRWIHWKRAFLWFVQRMTMAEELRDTLRRAAHRMEVLEMRAWWKEKSEDMFLSLSGVHLT